MNKQNIVLKTLTCFLLIFILTGCSTKPFIKTDIVNTAELADMMHKRDSAKQTNSPKMIRLDNGVIVYKDSSSSKAPSEYRDVNVSTSVQGIKFGPKEINFSPKTP